MCFEFRHISRSVSSFSPRFSFFSPPSCGFKSRSSSCWYWFTSPSEAIPSVRNHNHRWMSEWLIPAEQEYLLFILLQFCVQSTTILALLWQQLSFGYYMCDQWNSSLLCFPPPPPCNPKSLIQSYIMNVFDQTTSSLFPCGPSSGELQNGSCSLLSRTHPNSKCPWNCTCTFSVQNVFSQTLWARWKKNKGEI